ncbi:tetratricopeptide repeat protein [Acanthopleuribacter pedis]|uniref:Tetratricopeptide repeat protein n=1 Tax=Acanthopleuribacter pedis TaxID=442870 RepID=A0A8J7QG43_9BACT|nr:tetratricopeptide repeat protein [Acanthopleuribacter pedis]MBO1317963.1 tetratricopeptide repeat protein [Acanthopleuribacter pedis]
MPENNQPINETAAVEKRDLDCEELLVLLDLNVVYSTGDILDHWQFDVRVPEPEKAELRDRRARVQSYLGRYLWQREGALQRFFQADPELAVHVKEVLQPIRKEPYRGKRGAQRLYLGAQFVYFAERQLGRKVTVTTRELLALIAQAKERNERFDKSHFVRGVYKGRHGVSVVPHTRFQQLFGKLGLWRPASVLATGFETENSTIAIPKSLIKGTLLLAIGVSAGLVSGKYHFEKTEQEILLNFKKKWMENGPAAFDQIPKRAPESSSELIIATYRTALDLEVDISIVQKQVDPLISDQDVYHQAAGWYNLALGYLYRGELHLAIESFANSRDLLEKLSRKRDVLRRSVLFIAECYLYLGDEKMVLEHLEEAKLVNTKKYESLIYRFQGFHSLMKGELEQSRVDFEESIRLSLLEGDVGRTGVAHASLASVLVPLGELNEAYHHLLLAEEIAEKTKDSRLKDFVLSIRMLWAEEMGLPAGALANRLQRSKDPVNGNYVNTLLNFTRTKNTQFHKEESLHGDTKN